MSSSEQKISELKKNNSIYKIIFNRSPEVIVFVDLEGKVIDVNHRVFDWIQYKPEEIIGKKFASLEFMNEKTRELIINKFSRRLEGENISPYTIEVRSKDGEKHFGQVVAKPFKDDQGEILGSLTLISDITFQFEQTRMFKEASERSSALFNAIPDMIFILNREGTYIDLKADDEDLLAIPREEIIGKNINDAGFSDKYLNLVTENIKKTLNTGKVQAFEYALNTRKGEKIFECQMAKLNDDEVLSVIRDISKPKQIALDIERRQKYLESILNAIPEAIVTLDSSCKIVEWNPGAVSLFGFEKEDVIGKDIDDLITRSDIADEAKRFTKTVLAGELIPPSETIRYRKDGTSVNVLVSGSPFQIRGELQGVVAIYIDITLQKKIEEELKKADKLTSHSLRILLNKKLPCFLIKKFQF